MDLRGHGETPSLNSLPNSSQSSDQSGTLADAAADVAYTLNSLGVGTPDTVCGHSMVSAMK
jgi:pimeloyl-ACP methyl ester carboxylesterase